jgi:hypothetical protein
MFNKRSKLNINFIVSNIEALSNLFNIINTLYSKATLIEKMYNINAEVQKKKVTII